MGHRTETIHNNNSNNKKVNDSFFVENCDDVGNKI